MNTALMLMGTAWLAGSDPAGCHDCAGPVLMAAPCDPCASSPGLFSRLRSRMSGTPLFSRSSPCDPCGGSSPGLLSRLKARFHSSSDCCSPAPCAMPDCATAVGGCGLPPVPGSVTYPHASEHPMTMPAAPTPSAMPAAPMPAEAAPTVPQPDPLPKIAPKKIDVEIPSVKLPTAGPVVPF